MLSRLHGSSRNATSGELKQDPTSPRGALKRAATGPSIELRGAVVNSRFGVKRTTSVVLSSADVRYADHTFARDEFEYVCLDQTDPLSLHIKFRSRPRPKRFSFAGAAQAEEALQLVQDWSSGGLPGLLPSLTTTATPAAPSAADDVWRCFALFP